MTEHRHCPHCDGELVDKGHGPHSMLACRDCLADVPPVKRGVWIDPANDEAWGGARG